MSAGNLYETERKASVQRTVAITTSSAVTTYTARVGGTAYHFIYDRVINVITTSGNSLAITIPNGVYTGQRLTVNFVTEGSNESVTFTVTTGSATDLTASTGYTILEWTHASTGGWVELAASAT